MIKHGIVHVNNDFFFFLFNDLSSILENEKCGTTYNSCIPDPPLQMSSAEAVIGVLVLFVWFGLAFLSCWCRYNRRKQAEKRFIRRVQTAVAEVQQPRTVYLVVDPPAASVPLTNEQPPPSYEHIQN
jgi:hypothetical protein